MSTSGALDRSTLDQKDRAELQTIAQAMGGKPLSRARKAEIVDLILELAGADADGNPASAKNGGESKDRSGSGSDSGKASGSDTGKGSGSGSEKRTTAGEDSAAEGSKSDDDPDGGGRGSNDRASGGNDRGGNDGGDSNRGGSNRGGNDGGDSNRGDSNRGGNDRGGNDRGGNDRGGNDRGGNDRGGNDRGGSDRGGNDRGNRGANSGGSTSNGRDRGSNDRGQGNGEPSETGNRKRRRRGRGAERDDDQNQWNGDPVTVEGYLDLRDDGYGFLRVKGALPSVEDVYVPVKLVREFGMRRGDHIAGTSRPANRNEKNPALLTVEHVNNDDPKKAKDRPKFDDLTPLFPDERLTLERSGSPDNMTARIVDLLAPIGMGQRGMIVSPPKAGKTTVMKEIARSIEVNHPDVKLIVLLVDERPEEVTDMRRWLKHGEVVASTFDKPTDQHTAVAEMTIERAKRLVEMGEDVVIILDGITRLARAYNLSAPATGRVMTGGVDAGALYPPKRFFGAARNVEEGGSLTILATALVDTGSKMDEVIFEEFKGTGNMELRLDRRAAERRVYPAIDVDGSSTRHEELLFDNKALNQVWKLRRVLSGMANDEDRGRGNTAGLELLIERLRTFKTNEEFLAEVARGSVK